MMNIKQKKKFYQALLERNCEYDGVFFVGVKTTGIFCHASCPARKPKFENCEFYQSAKDALLAGFKPCKRCQPLCPPGKVPDVIKKLITAVEANPEKRWKAKDFREIGLDESTARRQFKKRFGMTFIEYARSRRMGLAMKEVKQGKLVIDAQHSAGYESASGFRDAFSKILGDTPSRLNHLVLKADWLETPLGPMLAICDDDYLYLLEFVGRRALEKEIERMRTRLKAAIIPGRTIITEQIETELVSFYEGKSCDFKTPLFLLGSDFQKKVWQALQTIPAGDTWSYQQLATAIGSPTSCRAVANANGCNQHAIIIPCHRVIRLDGSIGGYGGGVDKKSWLLNHEKKYFSK